MLFLIDAQLPPAVAVALRNAGHAALHVADLGLETARDREIWEEAVKRSAILVTKDRDFALRRRATNDGPAILWIRTGNVDNRSLIAGLMRALPGIQAEIERGETNRRVCWLAVGRMEPHDAWRVRRERDGQVRALPGHHDHARAALDGLS